jgi:TonB family protein
MALSALLLVAHQPAAAEPPAATPAGKWVVNFADQQCIASRDFVAEDRRVTLGLQVLPAETSSQLLLRFADQAPRARVWADATILIGGQKARARSLIAAPDARRNLVYHLFLKPEEHQRLLTTGAISIRGGDLGWLVFDLAPVTTLARVLRDCEADLLATWGLSREEQARQARFPELTNSFRVDYPRNAPKGAIGEVHARVDVSAAGAVSNCVVVRSSGHAALDAAACSSFLRLARFKPAVDKAGRPVRSLYLLTKRWILPGF